MNGPSAELEGTLRADGTIVLDEPPTLPPGRCRITLRRADEGPDVIEVLQRIRAEQAASGHLPRSRERIDADLQGLRGEDEGRMEEIEKAHERREGIAGQDPS